jgi:demethylmenaquinone methyltransferase / 2-methoxy-6-polyprenyl-1,4-benzoquinol methylase
LKSSPTRRSPPAEPPSLRSAFSTPDAKSRYVRRLFATIASRYDFITVVLSYGRDRAWKRRLVSLAAPLDGRRALDLAAGTGDITFLLESSGARAVGLDITEQMIRIAAGKSSEGQRSCAFLVGDMLALPFPEASFDVVTAGYGLRNVPDLSRAIGEMVRVLKPGGVALSLDFNRPSNWIVRSVYLLYLTVVGTALGWMLHRDPDTYRYIPASIRRYPGAEAVARLMAETGFCDVQYLPVMGGLMAIHRARKATHNSELTTQNSGLHGSGHVEVVGRG